MSQIFDALHQSAAEWADRGSREFSAAKELLQVVERKTAPVAPTLQQAPPSTREPLLQFPVVKAVLPVHAKLACFTESKSLAAEKFRFLATRLRHLQQKRAFKRLVITSSVPGEGKSVVAANLAYALAAGKQQVLLMEGDLRRPSLARHLGLGSFPGLGELLLNSDDEMKNIVQLEDSQLCILTAGDVHTNPPDVMESGKLSAIMDRVSVGFDWVIVDSPPVLPLADTTMWMRMADAIMLVTRPGVTIKRQLQRTLEAIDQSKLLGSVINASTEPSNSKYYYHYSASQAGPQRSNAAAK